VTDASIPREAGRTAFGLDPAVYDRARPPYPPALYALLDDDAELVDRRSILEVGAATGLATFELVSRGARRVTAVEPDTRLAVLLRAKALAARAPIEVVETAFEDATLEPGSFDLVVAATSFHWVDEASGLKAAHLALCPGGAVALWWMMFGDAERDDPFHEATEERLSFGARSPSAGTVAGNPHALDVTARRRALEVAGFGLVRHELFRSTGRFSPVELRELYSTFSEYQQLRPEERTARLDYVEATAAGQFGGTVERPLITSLYLARRP
jgi:SAM-dependent methyltransferase